MMKRKVTLNTYFNIFHKINTYYNNTFNLNNVIVIGIDGIYDNKNNEIMSHQHYDITDGISVKKRMEEKIMR